jgi:hypothetical protein
MTFPSFRRRRRSRTLAFGRFREVCTGLGATSRSFRSHDRRSGTTFEGFGTASEGFGTASEGVGTASEGFGTAFEGFRNASIGRGIGRWTVATSSLALARAGWIASARGPCPFPCPFLFPTRWQGCPLAGLIALCVAGSAGLEVLHHAAQQASAGHVLGTSGRGRGRGRGRGSEPGSTQCTRSRLIRTARWPIRYARVDGGRADATTYAGGKAMMPVDYSDRSSFGVLPVVDLDEPTEQSLRAEAAALGSNYTPFSGHPADLLADAQEMLGAEEDIADLMKRGYAVSHGLVRRIGLLRDMIAPLLAEEDRAAEWSKTQTEQAHRIRARLLEIRAALARIGKAAGLPPGLFSLETSSTTRLNVVAMKLEEVLANVKSVRKSLPDKKRVDQLVTEARKLLDEHASMRTDAKLTSVDSRQRVRDRKRLERLLFDAMVYLSAQGLAAYDGDEMREIRYRLDHVYGRKASKVGDPGAGGTTGEPGAAGPSDGT